MKSSGVLDLFKIIKLRPVQVGQKVMRVKKEPIFLVHFSLLSFSPPWILTIVDHYILKSNYMFGGKYQVIVLD